MEGLTAADVTGFLLRESARVSPGSACCYANRLRSLLRYLTMRGLRRSRAGRLPCPRWGAGAKRHPRVPGAAGGRAAARVVRSLEHESARATSRSSLLLARLGLRAVEVARLELDDLHWRAGEIEVDGKGHERARLPLPGDVGEAVVAYLMLRGRQRESPRVPDRARADATDRPAGCGPSFATRAAERASSASRLTVCVTRSPAELLREGASLIDIGQVLRHKHLESTAIYAKVDLARLRQAARPVAGSGTMTTFAQHVEDYLRLRRSLRLQARRATPACCRASPTTSMPSAPRS